MPLPDPEPQARPHRPAKMTVYFDGSCPLCTVEIGHYARQPGAEGIDFVDVAAGDADLGPGLTREAAMRRFHVRRGDGRLVSGARGFVAIWQVLPRWRRAARLAALPGVTRLMEAAYRLFLPIRPALSRLAGAFGARAATPRSGRRPGR